MHKYCICLYHLLRTFFLDKFSRSIISSGYLNTNLYNITYEFDQSSWWMPIWYFHNSFLITKTDSISLIDDPKLGIGDSFYRLAYLDSILPDNIVEVHLYVERRLLELYKEFKRKNFNRKIILKSSIISNQKFKGIIIRKSFIGFLARLIFIIFLLSRKNLPISLSKIDNKILLSKPNIRSLSIFSFPQNKFNVNNDLYFSFTFDCARKDSNLSKENILFFCEHYSLRIIQHTNCAKLETEIKSLEKLYLLKKSYTGFDPKIQISYILKSNLLISVASSLAKFAIVLNRPLLLILFEKFNVGFERFLKKENLVYENKNYQIYQSTNLLIFRFNMPNYNLKAKILKNALNNYLMNNRGSFFTNILNK